MMAELAGSIERATNISFVDYAGMKQQWDLGRELAYDETAITRMTDEIKMRAKDCAIDMWMVDIYIKSSFLSFLYIIAMERKVGL